MLYNRRDFLNVAGGVALTATGAATGYTLGREYAQGLIDSPKARRDFVRGRRWPYFRQYHGIRGTGRRTQTLLWKHYESVVGHPYTPAFQELGDCTGQSVATGANILTAVQIAMMRRPESWAGMAASEPLYAGGRVEIGNMNSPFDGAPLEYVVDFANKYGVLLRRKYGDIDLTKYDPKLAKRWASPGVGVPDALEPLARQHPIKTATLVGSFGEAADAIANGYPVAIGFHCMGFEFKTDHEGFAIPTYRRKKRWNHAMCIVGIDTVSRRKGACISNSWGTSWLKGPVHQLGVIPGGMWVDASLVDKMIRYSGVAIALSNYVGYPRQPVEYRLW